MQDFWAVYSSLPGWWVEIRRNKGYTRHFLHKHTKKQHSIHLCAESYQFIWLLSEHGLSDSVSELWSRSLPWVFPLMFSWRLFLCCWCWRIISAKVSWTSAMSLWVFCKAATSSERSTWQPFSFDCLSTTWTESVPESLWVSHLGTSVVLQRFPLISAAVWTVSSGDGSPETQLSRAVCSLGHGPGPNTAFCRPRQSLGGFHHRS